MYLFIAVAFGGMLFSGVKYYSDGNIIAAVTAALVPLLIFAVRARKIKPAIIINKKGIYAGGKFITDWRHFADAHFTQQQKLISIKDNFVLIVHSYRDNVSGSFKTTIPLGNTQNKSEEAVIEAIKYYFNLYKREQLK